MIPACEKCETRLEGKQTVILQHDHRLKHAVAAAGLT